MNQITHNPFEANRWLFLDALANYKLQNKDLQNGLSQVKTELSIEPSMDTEDQSSGIVKRLAMRYYNPLADILSQAA